MRPCLAAAEEHERGKNPGRFFLSVFLAVACLVSCVRFWAAGLPWHGLRMAYTVRSTHTQNVTHAKVNFVHRDFLAFGFECVPAFFFYAADAGEMGR